MYIDVSTSQGSSQLIYYSGLLKEATPHPPQFWFAFIPILAHAYSKPSTILQQKTMTSKAIIYGGGVGEKIDRKLPDFHFDI